jgi:hypothetical protein
MKVWAQQKENEKGKKPKRAFNHLTFDGISTVASVGMNFGQSKFER